MDCLQEGANYPSPITRVLALGYYDGPTNGVLQCGDGGRVYKFDLMAGPVEALEDADALENPRVFGLAPLRADSLAQLIESYTRYWTPRWPVWVPLWHFEDSVDEATVNRHTDGVLRQAEPMEWIVATDNLIDTIRAARSVTKEDLVRVSDWLAFLGVENPSPRKAEKENVRRSE